MNDIIKCYNLTHCSIGRQTDAAMTSAEASQLCTKICYNKVYVDVKLHEYSAVILVLVTLLDRKSAAIGQCKLRSTQRKLTSSDLHKIHEYNAY